MVQINGEQARPIFRLGAHAQRASGFSISHCLAVASRPGLVRSFDFLRDMADEVGPVQKRLVSRRSVGGIGPESACRIDLVENALAQTAAS